MDFTDDTDTHGIVMFERYKASYLGVIENGEKIGIMRADDLLHTYRFERSVSIKNIHM